MKLFNFLGFISFAAAVLLSGCGSSQGRLNLDVKHNTGVHGKWSGATKKFHADGTTEKTFVIQPDKIGLEVKCKMNSGETLYASALSKAQITANSIIVQEASHGDTIINGNKCSAELSASTFHYVVLGNSLVLDGVALKRE